MTAVVKELQTQKTLRQYQAVVQRCRDIFRKKHHDYGSAWRVLRHTSLTDQIYIKAKRIKSIEETGVQKVSDKVDGEYIGIINYCVMALVQLELGASEDAGHMPEEKVLGLFDSKTSESMELMQNKNHDYGEAWRDMRVRTFTDLILMKLLRIKQIEDLGGQTLISEGIDANYHDIMNYAIFALIRLSEADEDNHRN